ncbi:glycine betaine ABC transporter substrate-binding protein [Microbacterium oryzae]|uniref:glycine betaine ABC transporter substrate-binding protein n=1 Tax=Microbacterium oryzae TaxID=743009 RepID=UPI0025B1E266|nr:glycine betaine ABC transporter substrate-binding protein [Microbacterium oryzae]MDN3309475.1 glycine betaine ABC transporter substrate-binding protein [Microbacterium oryzae]
MTKRILAFTALTATAALALTGCAGSDEAAGDDDSKGSITIAVFNGWDEGVATSELWKAVLENEGYDVELEYADVAPLFTGLSTGDYDFTTDVWLPVTHASYLEKFGDSIEELGAWNDESRLTVAVNSDAPIDSLSELADSAGEFGDQIVGIEPGAGLTLTMDESVIPTYGLEDMDFTTSSTAAMLTELEAAEQSGENIVVTLWEPHWAYGAYDIKNLEDPEGALGDAESLYSYGREGFGDDFPEVAEWLSNFQMDLDTLYDLENLLFVENDTDDYAPLIDQWIEDNQEYVDSLTS